MAKRLPSQNSIVLDQVKVIIDPKTGTVKIVGEDAELPTVFALGVQKGGKLEKDLLTLLHKYGIVDGDDGDAKKQVVEATQPASSPTTNVDKGGASTTSSGVVGGGTGSNQPNTTTGEETETTPPGLIQPEVLPANPHSPTVIKPVGAIPQLDPTRLGNLVSVFSPTERSGKSTTSVMIASALVRNPEIHKIDNPHKVVVIDYDFTHRMASSIADATEAGGMLGVYETGKISKETLLENIHYNEKLGIHVLPVGNLYANPVDYLGLDFLNKTIEELKKIFTVIVVDSNANNVSYTHHWLVAQSDLILLTSGVSRATEFDVRTWLKGHVKYNRTVKKLTVLLTSTPKLQIMASFDDVKKVFQPLSIVGNIPTDSAVFLNAVKNGTLDVAFSSHNAVADAYRAVASRLLGAT